MENQLQFRLPDVGEGLTEAEIVSWLVAVGDPVEVNQMIVEIETAKSIVELPSPYAGTITALHASAGETVAVGTPIVTVSVAASPASPDDTPTEAPQLLVGYGPREPRITRRKRQLIGPPPATAITGSEEDRPRPPRATPVVRKLAKDLGVSLLDVLPTGRDDTVTREDVLAHSAGNAERGGTLAPATLGPADGVLRIPIKGVRKHTAAAVTASAFTAPHVTEFITLDISKTMDLRRTITSRREFAGTRVTPLALVARALLIAVSRTPEANARWDEQAQEIVQMREVNLGIAAATPRGLIVPNIKSAQSLSLLHLAESISNLAATARDGKTAPADQAGGTITITNIGVFGVDTGTPILNQGEAAILALGAIRRCPWVVQDNSGERIEPRWTTQLALSFDHRVMDGQQGSALLADTASILAEPGLALL